jgi:hypothetical protein
MPRKKSPISVRVKDSFTDGDQRSVSIEILAPQSSFSLSDLLAQEGAIDSLPTRLKDSVRGVIEGYIDSGSQTLAEVSKLLRSRTQPTIRSEHLHAKRGTGTTNEAQTPPARVPRAMAAGGDTQSADVMSAGLASSLRAANISPAQPEPRYPSAPPKPSTDLGVSELYTKL